ncbi:hypothetical protein F66182_6936 [Fusarium sp. NRRL 66182]|nr:hypothetical protein F66182_6936 [Fusarium sp. NRRL 66182]
MGDPSGMFEYVYTGDRRRRGVEALAQSHGRKSDFTSGAVPPSPSHSLDAFERVKSVARPGVSWPCWHHPEQNSISGRTAPWQIPVASPGHRTCGHSPSRKALQRRFSEDTLDSQISLRALAAADDYHNPSPDLNSSHINQKYTIEESDFIIYARHDKRMKWSHVEQEFAARFGHSPRRTIQGLQACHYRLNNHIPVWDEDGWLCFDNEDDVEPRHVGIKCREIDKHRQRPESLGIAQRYPERAVHYAWVDPEIRFRSRDWGMGLLFQ